MLSLSLFLNVVVTEMRHLKFKTHRLIIFEIFFLSSICKCKFKWKCALSSESTSQRTVFVSRSPHFIFLPKLTPVGWLPHASFHWKALSRTLVICMLTKLIISSQYSSYSTSQQNSTVPTLEAGLLSSFSRASPWLFFSPSSLVAASWLVLLYVILVIGLPQDAVLALPYPCIHTLLQVTSVWLYTCHSCSDPSGNFGHMYSTLCWTALGYQIGGLNITWTKNKILDSPSPRLPSQ